MYDSSLNNIRIHRSRLQLVLAVLLFVWMGMNMAIISHGTSHATQSDNHCSLCAASAIFGHSQVGSSPSTFTSFNTKPQLIVANNTVVISIWLATPGNRDPPLTV